jgi:hypothetical protein
LEVLKLDELLHEPVLLLQKLQLRTLYERLLWVLLRRKR